MYNSNSGYIDQSMSVRAKRAYNEGLLSKSKIKKDDLEQAGINLPLSFVKWMMPNIITPTEWHHTSKHFNKTDFYDLEDVKEQLEDIDVESRLAEYKEEKEEERFNKEKKQQEKGYYAYVEYGEWSGSRNHPKLTKYKDYAYIKGNWAYIRHNHKKKVTGNHFRVLKTYKIKPKKMNTKVRNDIFLKLKVK